MSIITIREQQKTETGFQASVSFDDATTGYLIEVRDPFSPGEEERLEWYFEKWSVFPYVDTVRAEAAKVSVRAYGESLFEQVFKRDIEAYSAYKQSRDSIRQIKIIGKSPEFQALHWEALHDPQMPRPLAIDRVMVRQVQSTEKQAIVAPSPVINLLVVTARPGEENDVNHRTISRPLIEAIQTSQLRVKVDLLRPATFEALSKHLEEKGDGFYHIVHLDMHGAVMSYEELQSMPPDRFTFRAFGQDVERFEGRRGFLSFESGTPGQSDLRIATELAALLKGKNVPVCILNACQSAKQVKGDERETSLGAALMAAGMQTVLAMGYSVTVSAAEILMTTLYQQLFAQKSLDEAIRLGRKALSDRQERKTGFVNKTIKLEDWLLPVVYRRGEVDLNLRSFTPQEEDVYWQQQERVYEFEKPTYGFVGRDLEILKIERSLLRQNVLLVQGMGGTGKTTLLNYLREWWQTTQFVKEVFYFGYDQKAHTLEQILFAIGQRVYDKYEAAQFQVMSVGGQVQKLAATLNSQPYGLMLDNLESVTGQALAIENTLDLQEQEKLRDFLRRLVGGKTKVVLGSRNREAWLDKVLRGAVYELQGLDREAREVLAGKILAQQMRDAGKIERMLQSDDFRRLMKLLAGYPLAMEVVLGNLRRQSAAEILAGLDAADVNLDSGSGDKTASILKCVEYSHSNLSPDAQKLLVCLAPFSGFLVRSLLPRYAEQLRQLAPFAEYRFEQFDGAVGEAIGGLLSPMDADNPQLLTIQPVFPYFLKTKLNQLDAATREALFEGFKTHYQGLAGYYNQLMESKEPRERQMGILFCKWEYENLYNALQICLEKQERVGIFSCLDTYFQRTSDIQSGLKLATSVAQALKSYPAELKENELADQVIIVFGQRASKYLETQQYSQAREAYREVLDTLTSAQSLDEQQKQSWVATTYHQLGRVAQELREFEQARSDYQQALKINVEFNDRYEQAVTYYQLGKISEELEELEEAKTNYLQDLQITAEFNDQHGLGISLRNLARFYQKTQDEDFLAIAASTLGTTVDQLKTAILSD